jgi:putative molybdopterin biosynthesis protein
MNRVRRARLALGLSQGAFARQAGISRQALSAIESGVYQPGVEVALRLARELGQSVESLFGEAAVERLRVSWRGPDVGSARPLVALATVRGRLVAVPHAAAQLRFAPAGGRLERVVGEHAEVAAFRSRDEIDAVLLVAGCDPAVTVLADWLARRRARVNLVPLQTSSEAALSALVEERVHVAGLHLFDRESGEYNLVFARQALGRQSGVVITFARWELGLAVARGNPRGIRGLPDLGQTGLRVVNRELGSGARALLDEAIAGLGIDPAALVGYGRELGGHLDVAAAVAADQADLGVTIRLAADVFGLAFLPIREERYDLLVLESEVGTPPVKAMLDALTAARFAAELRGLCAYDTSETGQVRTTRVTPAQI